MFKRLFCLYLLLASLGAEAAVDAGRLVDSARAQVGVTLSYDPVYRRIAYPGGDVPLATGVCTDVVIRALREQGLDLQKLVHEDMRSHFSAYPRNWGLKRPDPNIDHRRVPNLMTWFKRQGMALTPSDQAASYRPGDIVTWDLGRGLQHIGILSDRTSAEGAPLALHNIGRGTQEEDILFRYRIIGHYRIAER
ncbi:DUF1287 domain-containing protein [Pseudomonas sp. No.21]|jgi:hypothetical protein|uniref:DUF1287 domain-containing protein n=1 Tax=Pseudomonas TaxID=286 RepID=UPI000DA981EA|nr:MULTISPECIES: DUF1287 domain-containing protein [Pseudomonas]MDW3715840.1 DUF1287 domain-containing protein [Pseudomonas sp. 2023EL-01195]PZE11444.1 DUF1287 domain-containing protein [Pseudomonas sp. 57B-090624]GJN49656.1 DUF1287 domain-containing protein [Pseudomonas tohonis]